MQKIEEIKLMRVDDPTDDAQDTPDAPALLIEVSLDGLGNRLTRNLCLKLNLFGHWVIQENYQLRPGDKIVKTITPDF